jgi:hypothetical protein
LITWKVQADGTKSVVWKTKARVAGDGLYFLVLDCGDGSSNTNVAVYAGGLPNDGGTLLWAPTPPPSPEVPVACTPTIFLERNERVSKGHTLFVVVSL